MAPQKIGHFTIVAELATMEGGAVYKATAPKGQTVALRTLRLDAPDAAQVVPAFQATAKAASALASPNIAGIFGGGQADGQFFIAVEFVEGVKLSTNLAKGEPAPMSEVLDLSRQVCTALDHAQSKGIVHPELKPTNIIVEWDGTAKLMDFGVPRSHPATELSEATYYLSPEEVRGEPLTLRSNLFTWAAIAYQMATGKKPFDAADAETLRKRIVEEMPAPAHEVNPKLPPRVSEIFAKAMAKSPAERYATGSEFLTALENYKKVETPPPVPVANQRTSGIHAKPVLTPSAGTSRPASASPAPRPAAAPAPAPKQATPPPAAKPAVAAPAAQSPAPAAATASKPVPPAPAAAAAPKPAAAAGPSKNLLMYGMGAVILLLVGIVVGLFLRNSGQQPGATAPTPEASPQATVPAAPGAATPGAQPTPGAPRTVRAKQQAAAPAETAAPTGGLTIDSTPQGADVQIDGRHEANWVTPFTATGLAAGGHAVSFSKPGHMSAVRSAQVTAGQNAIIAAQLTEMAATISVSSEPAGANILVDGRDIGKLTPAQVVVQKGSHTIAVRKQGYLDASSTLEVAPGQTVQFSPALKLTGSTENIRTVSKLGGIFGGAPADSGRVSVKTNPKGAQVLVNGQAVKKTTPVDFYLNPGTYELTVTMEGYKPVKKIIDVQKGGKLAVDEALSK